MKDIEFGLLAQLAYYNWHNYDKEEKNLYEIFKYDQLMKPLTDGKSEGFIKNTSGLQASVFNNIIYI